MHDLDWEAPDFLDWISAQFSYWEYQNFELIVNDLD